MKYALLLFLLALNTQAAQERILNWRATEGITEKEALVLAKDAIAGFFAYDEDGVNCGVEEMWGFEYDEANVGDETPVFAVEAYARGPYDQCAAEDNYDCRVLFKKENGTWGAEYADCEPTGFEE